MVVVEGTNKPHSEELRHLHASPNVRVMKSRRMSWTGHITHRGKREMHTYF